MGMDFDDLRILRNGSRRFGHIPDVPEGAWFRTRKDVLNADVHGLIRKGIHGDRILGAFSVMLCGKYEDEDLGDTIIYTGSGGLDKDSGKPNANQSMIDFDNASLKMSEETGRPVRVTRRGERRGSGYIYAGLYRVDSCYMKRGRCGFELCFFELNKIVEGGDAGPSQSGEKAPDAADGFSPSGVNSGGEGNDGDGSEEEEEAIMREGEGPKAE